MHSFIVEHKIPIELQLKAGLLSDCSFLALFPTLTSLPIIGGYHGSPRFVKWRFHFLRQTSLVREDDHLPCPRLSMLEVEGDTSLTSHP